MNSLTVINTIAAPFSFSGFIGLLFGLVAPLFFYRAIDKYKHQAVRTFQIYTIFTVTGVVSVYFLLFFAVRAEKSAIITESNTAQMMELSKAQKETTAQIAECNSEFFDAIANFVTLTKTIGDQNSQQLSGLIDYVDAIAEPPPDIESTPIDSPRHIAWFRATAKRWGDQARKIQSERQNTMQQRNDQDIPRPKCGKH